MNIIQFDDIIKVYFEPGYIYLQYSDIIENSKNMDIFKRFLLKLFDEHGNFTNTYCSATKYIFFVDPIYTYAEKFNPEKII